MPGAREVQREQTTDIGVLMPSCSAGSVIIMTGLRQKASSPSSLRYIYRVLVLHGVVLKRETGADGCEE